LFTLSSGAFLCHACSTLKLQTLVKREKSKAQWLWFEPILLGGVIIADKVNDLGPESLTHLYAGVFALITIRYVICIVD